MKRCPTCYRTYSDETMTFCLADGSLLSAPYATEAGTHRPDSAPTEVMPRHVSVENAPPTLVAQYGAPYDVPVNSLPGRETKSDERRITYQSEGHTRGRGESQFLIELGARAKRASLYVLMRILVAVAGMLSAYFLYNTVGIMEMSDDAYWSFRIARRLFVGILLVTGQVLLLRKYFKPMWAWVLLTLSAILIASFIDYFLVYFVRDLIFESNNELLINTVWPVLLEIDTALPWLLIALAQWPIIYRCARGSWLWMVAAILASAVAYIMGKAIVSLDLSDAGLIGDLLFSVLDGLNIGLVQAAALLLLRSKDAALPAQRDYL